MLVDLKTILADTRKKHYAVGLFNCVTLEMTKGILAAAEELRAPVILQTTPSTVKYADYEKLLKENTDLQEANLRLSAELAAVRKKLSVDSTTKKKLSAEEKAEETQDQKGDMSDGGV